MNAACVAASRVGLLEGAGRSRRNRNTRAEESIQMPAACSRVEENGTALERKAGTTGLWLLSGAEMQNATQILCLESPQLNPKFTSEGSPGSCTLVTPSCPLCAHVCQP